MFVIRICCFLLHLGNDGLEGFGAVDGEVGEDLAVDFDAGFVEGTHQLGVRETFEAGSSVDTLNPESAKVALFGATVAERIGQTFFPGVFGNGPDVLTCAIVAACKFQNSFSFRS